MELNEIKAKAENGNALIEEAIIALLHNHIEGLSNTEIARILNLESSHEGSQINYLTYSVLGNLMKNGSVIKKRIRGNKVKYCIRQE